MIYTYRYIIRTTLAVSGLLLKLKYGTMKMGVKVWGIAEQIVILSSSVHKCVC